MLTADAGISKSSFYKFFSSKELLFLEIANDWEMQVIAAVNESLKTSVGTDDKRRAANMVYTAFTTIHALGICNFLCDDLPELARFIPEEEARSHYLSSAQGIFDMLHHAEIHQTTHKLLFFVVKSNDTDSLHLNNCHLTSRSFLL
jgi:AcrR family transcriptional regulator